MRVDDRRLRFFHACVQEVDTALRALGGYLIVRRGRAAHEVARLARDIDAESVFVNHEYGTGRWTTMRRAPKRWRASGS